MMEIKLHSIQISFNKIIFHLLFLEGRRVAILFIVHGCS